MYEDLEKSLRSADKEEKDLAKIYCVETNELFGKAADAIEELSRTVEEQKAQIITMAAEDKPQWIRAEESLPDEWKTVLVAFDSFSGKEIATSEMFYNDHNRTTWSALCGKNPTHWMPLPEPPKEEQDG